MKSLNYQERFYRNRIQADGLKKIEVIVKETDILFLLDREINRDFLRERIIKYRKDIEDYIKEDKKFLVSLEPLEVKDLAPEIVKEMAFSAKLAGTGPMAAVSGAISDFVGRDLLNLCSEVIIENGGDIFIKSERPRVIGIYAGKSILSDRINIRIKSKKKPLGVCTSSGKVGHSLSFGNTDSVTVISDKAAISDAVATKVANLIKRKEDVKKAIDFTRRIKQVRGIIIIMDDLLASFGEIEFV